MAKIDKLITDQLAVLTAKLAILVVSLGKKTRADSQVKQISEIKDTLKTLTRITNKTFYTKLNSVGLSVDVNEDNLKTKKPILRKLMF